MSKTLRNILIVVGILVVLLLVAPFLIPVNSFRPTIEEKASAALGRKVQLGDLSLSLLSGSLSAQNLSVADDPKFSSSPFLTAKSVKVGVEIMPLIFSKTVNVTGVTIDSPQVTLIHTPAGKWNYSSLGSSAAKTEAKTPGASTEFSVGKLALNGGTIIVGSTNSQARSTYDHVDVAASDVSLASKFPVTVTGDLPGGGKLKLDGQFGPVEQDADLTPLDAKLNVTNLDLAKTGFLDPSVGLGGLVDMDATVVSKGGEAETKGKVIFSKALLVAGGSPSGVPVTIDFNSKYDLRKDAGVLNPSTLKIGNAMAHLSGPYHSAGETTIVNIKVDAKDMPAKDLEAFLPSLGIHIPKGASLAAGMLNSDLTITGPTNHLVTSGNVGLLNGKLANFDLGSKMSAISMLTGIKTGQDLIIEKLTSNLHVAPDGIKADHFIAVIPQLGTLIGAGTVDAKNNLDFKMVATLARAAGGTSAPAADVTSGIASALGGLLGKPAGGGSPSAQSKGQSQGLHVPFLVQGTTSDPKFIPDVSGLAIDMLKSQLGNLTATPSINQPGQNPNPTDALGQLGGLLKKKKPPQ